MTVTYWYAPEVEAIAKRLVAHHHRHLLDLAPTEIRYVYRSEASKSKGKINLGKARKVTGFNAFLACEYAPTVEEESGEPEPIFVIEIAHDQWENLSMPQREALVDHELCHCVLEFSNEGTPVKIIKPHDLEEFTEVVERHGLWRPDVAAFMARGVRANPTLFEMVDETTGEIRASLPDSPDSDLPDNIRQIRPQAATVERQEVIGQATTGSSAAATLSGTVSFGGGPPVPFGADPAAAEPVPKIPHDLSPLAGRPCLEDGNGEYDHRGCDEAEAEPVTDPDPTKENPDA